MIPNILEKKWSLQLGRPRDVRANSALRDTFWLMMAGNSILPLASCQSPLAWQDEGQFKNLRDGTAPKGLV